MTSSRGLGSQADGAGPATRRSLSISEEGGSSERLNLLGLSERRLGAELESWADKPYRVRQVFDALHRQRVADIDDMTVLSKAARRALGEAYSLERPAIDEVRVSRDGTVKLLFRLADGATIEAVDIPDRGRRTLCISSQAGCALGCTFCVTGAFGAGRDLTVAEIVGQVYALSDRWQTPVENCRLVLMGMGEPLLNLEAVGEALLILSTSIPWSRMTVSTAGVVPGIRSMAKWTERPNLALSLHAPDDERRSQLMPINRKYPLPSLLEAALEFPATRRRPLFIEYTLIAGVNDSLDDAVSLARLLEPLEAKVNLIPMNPDPSLDPGFTAPKPEAVRGFQRALIQRGMPTSVRRRRGDDVSAACGQLRGKVNRLSQPSAR